jgi:hypothetical protein
MHPALTLLSLLYKCTQTELSEPRWLETMELERQREARNAGTA